MIFFHCFSRKFPEEPTGFSGKIRPRIGYLFCIFIEQERIPDTCLKIFSMFIQMNGINSQTLFVTFSIPEMSSDRIRGTGRQIRRDKRFDLFPGRYCILVIRRFSRKCDTFSNRDNTEMILFCQPGISGNNFIRHLFLPEFPLRKFWRICPVCPSLLYNDLCLRIELFDIRDQLIGIRLVKFVIPALRTALLNGDDIIFVV